MEYAMNPLIKSFLMLSLLAIALQAFPKLASAEGYANESVEPERSEYCFTLNHDGSENIVGCNEAIIKPEKSHCYYVINKGESESAVVNCSEVEKI